MSNEDKSIMQNFLTLENAWPKGPLGATFLTSYTFHAPFFEAQLLSLLRARGAHPIVVFLDRYEGYATTMATLNALHGAGRHYYLIPYDTGGFAFHPKVHLFCGPGGACLVGSGNLTPHGCGGNLEAFDILDTAVDGSAVGRIRGFFRTLLERCNDYLPPEETSWIMSHILQADDPPPGIDEAVFIHSLKRGIREQIIELLMEEKYLDLLTAAPFHSRDHAVSRGLAGDMGKPRCRLAANPLEAPTPPRGADCGLLLDPHNRYLHAKIVHARGMESSFLMIGSANFTSAAWRYLSR